MINIKKHLTGQKLLGAYETCIKWLGLLHKWIAIGFLFVFRSIGKGLGYIPWAFRYTIGLGIAGLLIAWVCINGSSLFLLKSTSSLESFADRNENRISLDKTDFGVNLKIRLFTVTDAQKAMFKKIVELLSKAETGDTATPEQLKLAAKIVGIDYSFVEGAERVLYEDSPERIEIQLHTEKPNGAMEDPHITVVNPTPEQLKLMEPLKQSERFSQVFANQLEQLVTAENRSENSAKRVTISEVTGIKVSHEPAYTELSVVNMPALETEDMEKVELAFDEENTVHISSLGQYAAFRASEPASIVQDEIDKQNEKLRNLALLEDEKLRADLAAQADAAVLGYKASHGRIRKDEEKAIRDAFAEKFKKNEPLVIKKEGLKGSLISEWYEKKFKQVKFNPDNLRFEPTLLEIIYDNHLAKPLDTYTGVTGKIILLLVVIGFAASIIAGLVKPLRRPAYYAILGAGIAFTAYWLVLISVAFDLPDQLLNVVTKKEIFSSEQRNDMWFDYLWFWFPAVFFSFFLWFPLLLSSAKRYFNVPVKSREIGDVMAKNLTCQTPGSGIYRAFYWVGGYHFVILLVLPVLLNTCYLEDEYNIPKGDGGGQIAPQQVVKKKPKKKKKKRFVLNPNSAFLFSVPEMPDDLLMQEFDEATESQYQTTSGTIGGGKKGGKPGWPNGMDNGVIRFIRLEYSGGDWDHNYGKGADYNMLIKLKEFAGFNIASDTESIKVDEIEKRFRNKKKKPPFVYLTGSRSINMTTTEVKQLRKYLLEDGGMIFADNGGGNFNSSFRNLMKRILPNHELVDISNDDIIYQQPFIFPNGAPRLFHHSGDRALGVKNNGRWIVFYHQGDIGDAWKSGGAGLSKQQVEMAFRLGANVIAYAFGEYLRGIYGEQ